MTRNWIRTLALVAACSTLSLADARAADVMPDAWITTKVKLVLLTSEGVGATSVNVDTIDGRVTLHGTVDTEAEKTKAEQLARTIDGARDVRNLLQVVKPAAQKEMAVSDAELKSRVSAALAKDSGLERSEIEVASVNKGVVLLAGSALTLSDTLRAVELAARVDGVARVASEIESPDTLGDAEVWRDGKYDATAAARSTAQDMWTTSAVKLRLLANSTTPGFDINVDTEGGAVTLFGIVDSEAAKAAAGAEARSVEGVKSLVNELQVVAPEAQASVAANDDSIDDAVEERLQANARLHSSAIAVEVKNGVVRLTGTVDSQSDRITALTVTRATRGVRGLVDDLKVVPPSLTQK